MRFELVPWQKPVFADDGLVVPIGGIAAIFGMGFGFLAPDMLRWPVPLAWVAAIAAVLAVSAAAWFVGHRPFGPGSIVFRDGAVTIDDGRSAPYTRPIPKLKHAMVMRFRGRESVVLHFHGDWLATQIRTERLLVLPTDVLAAARVHVAAHGDLTAFDAASQWQAATMQWTLAICAVIAVAFELWRMFG